MSLLISMLPLYLLGNLHCMGMCGPLAMMLGKNRYRYYYFFGRIMSFSAAGWIAGQAGAVLNLFFAQYHISFMASLLFGIVFVGSGLMLLTKVPVPPVLTRQFATINQSLTVLMLKDEAWPTFLFGFFTIALPCGQTLLVFSACALAGDGAVGLLNGFVFALLTTPSLWLAMHARNLFAFAKQYYNTLIGGAAILVGLLSIARAAAEMGWIAHFVLSEQYHIVIY